MLNTCFEAPPSNFSNKSARVRFCSSKCMEFIDTTASSGQAIDSKYYELQMIKYLIRKFRYALCVLYVDFPLVTFPWSNLLERTYDYSITNNNLQASSCFNINQINLQSLWYVDIQKNAKNTVDW